MKQTTPIPRLLAATAALALLAGACGSAASPVADGPTDTSAPTSTIDVTTTIAPAGGWIGDEPDWTGGGGAGEMELADSGERLAVESDAASGEAYEASAPADDGGVAIEAPIAVEPDGGIGDGAEPFLIEEPPVDGTPLRAGSVDDNVDFDDFLAYLERLDGIGISRRDLDPRGRSIVSVTDSEGRPSPGVAVEVSAGDQLITLRTTADGTVRFHPAFYGVPADATISYGLASVDMELIEASTGDDVTIVSAGVDVANPVPLDVLFLLDATGSMGDEIDRLKTTIDSVAERVASLDPAPDVRFAMTLYRDEGDAFVTANYDFTGDIVEFQSALADVVANGGGDYPEALDEGLADALAKPAWRDPAEAVQLIFVVADAPPQVGRQVATPYTDSIRTAIERGIKIFPVASSESDDQAEAVFRQMAQATGAPFVFLSNGANGAATGASTDIASTDYEELALDELVVRLIAEELNDLAGTDGGDITVPTTIAPPTTNPDGQ